MRHECGIDVGGSPCGEPAVDFIPAVHYLDRGKLVQPEQKLWLCAEHYDMLTCQYDKL